MIGLYLLTTNQLAKDKTIKFGMSMRIQFRWIDYLAIFNDSKYIYYYEFLDALTREEILSVEDEILQLHKDDRNEFYQTEYFYCKNNKKFHQTIIDVLNKQKINYKFYDIHNFDRKYYDNKPEPFETILKIKQNQIVVAGFTPYDYQQEILNIIENYYANHDIGKIIWSCGLGKALLSILIVQKLNCKTVVIGVPSIYLQKQMKNEIMKIFTNYKNIIYIGGSSESASELKSELVSELVSELKSELATKSKLTNENHTIKSYSNKDDINKFINEKSADCKFIITTYDSCHKLSNINFDFKIGDEAHHLVGSENEKTKDSFHKIKSNKSLFMTATEKVIENKTDKVIYSMDDKNIFGELIDLKSINWAIENKKITDYNLIILKNTNDEINNIINSLNLVKTEEKNDIIKNKDLFLSAFMSLKSIEKYNDLTHILIYTNKTENCELVKKYIDIILDLNIININKENNYNKALHSKSSDNLNDIKLSDGSIKPGEITKFKKASWGIISSVYIFGEGFDCPILNGVVFAENMESDIRIVQSVLRPNRLDKNFPDKKAYVIIPYIDTEDFITDGESFDKCRKIIAKIRNVDEKIEQKITVVSLNKIKLESESDEEDDTSDEVIKQKIKYHHIIDNGDELTKIMLRLRYSRALGSINSVEQDEFNYIKQLNKELNIQSKEEYAEQITKNKHKNYIEKPEEYFKSKGVWTNWYDFMGVDTNKFIQDKNDWINFCKDKNVKSLEDYNKLCLYEEDAYNKQKSELYKIIPRNPLDFYIGCLDIPIELEFKTKRRG